MTGDANRDHVDEVTSSLTDLDSSATADHSILSGERPPGTVPANDPIGRYDLREEIARGGMGEVYLAVDRTLARQVAVKILQAGYKAGSTTARRFLDEARISAQLQHPGIPPIHDLGTLPDGRPFLAMKLIKGQTLDDLLRKRTDTNTDRGRFLAAFEQVCQAVAYAHARRVIHRDLKPQNIMVGAFGEVQVMDWGLAKVLGETPERSRPTDSDERLATEILSARDDSDGSETQAGSILGTPAYMAPEQAVGAVEQVDERSDVFGLGAVLAVILTGHPPFVGDTAESTRVLAARGKVDDCFARIDAFGAEPELVALCKRCLSPEREDRPADAGAIASAVAAFRAEAEERARQAELDRVRAEGERARLEAESRAQRQKRRAQLAVAAGLVGLLVIGCAAWLTIRNQSEARRADAERLTGIALGRTMQLAIQARAIDAAELSEANAATRLWEQAETNIEQAEEAVAGGGGPTLKAFVAEKAAGIRTGLDRARRDATLLASLEAADAADIGTDGGSLDRRASIRAYRSAFEAAGLPAGGDAATLAEAVRAERPGPRSALLRALGRWMCSLKFPPDPDVDRVRATADLVDPDPTRKEIRATVAGRDKEALARLAGRLVGVDLPPASAVMLGEGFYAMGLHREAVRILRSARDRYPSDLSLLTSLSGSLSTAYPGDPVVLEEGVGCARTMVALYPSNAFSHYRLGQCLMEKDLASAELHFRETLELNPRFAHAMMNLAWVMHRKGDLAGEEEMTRKAAETDPQFATAHRALGNLLRQKGDLAGAEAEYLKCLAIDPKRSDVLDALAAVRRMIALLPRLEDVVAGRKDLATPREALDLGLLCYWAFRKHYAAVRLIDRAFADEPKLAADMASLVAANRYNAACAAALAGDGQGADAPSDPAGRLALREQALAWLRADLAIWSKQALSEKPDERKASADQMEHWLADGDFNSVRPGTPKYDLPANERAAWESLWADVRATLAVAQKPIPPVTTSPKP